MHAYNAYQCHDRSAPKQSKSTLRSRVLKKTRYGFLPEPHSNPNPEVRHIKTQANETLASVDYTERRSPRMESKSISYWDRIPRIQGGNTINSFPMNGKQLLPMMGVTGVIKSGSVAQQTQSTSTQRALNNIEQRLDALLKQKLKLLIQSNQQRVSEQEKRNYRSKVAQLNQELKELVSEIKDSSDGDSNRSILQQWRALDNKLQLLDKTLAESKTELEIMKGYFSRDAHRRTEYKQMCRPSRRLIEGPPDIHHHKSLDNTNGTSTRHAVPMLSITKQTYEAPQEEDYEKYRYKQPAYEPSLRPVPSSSYKESYQNFSGLKLNDRCNQKDELNRLGPFKPEYTKKNSGSPLQVQRTNYRELDCFIDKFKSLKVSYLVRKPRVDANTSLEFAKLEKEINTAPRESNPEPLQRQARQVSSIAMSSYKPAEEDAKEMLRNPPKNNRLDHFANDFRHLIKL